MYIPRHFSHDGTSELVSIAREYSFGMLISVIDSAPFVSHLPLLIDLDEEANVVLTGHVAKANPHWHQFESATSVAVFQGPHTYISPTWYETAGVPTWNYAAVHMRGQMEILNDADQKAEIVHRLSAVHEAENPAPWVPDYPDSMLDAIVGFRMAVNQIDGKMKLSQNRPQADKDGVLAALTKPFDSEPGENQIAIRNMMQQTFTS